LRRAGRPAEAVRWYRAALATGGSEPGQNFLRRRIAECDK
jgi:RNA polymerase sigma-70 factor (ECF subfamily)